MPLHPSICSSSPCTSGSAIVGNGANGASERAGLSRGALLNWPSRFNGFKGSVASGSPMGRAASVAIGPTCAGTAGLGVASGATTGAIGAGSCAVGVWADASAAGCSWSGVGSEPPPVTEPVGSAWASDAGTWQERRVGGSGFGMLPMRRKYCMCHVAAGVKVGHELCMYMFRAQKHPWSYEPELKQILRDVLSHEHSIRYHNLSPSAVVLNFLPNDNFQKKGNKTATNQTLKQHQTTITKCTRQATFKTCQKTKKQSQSLAQTKWFPTVFRWCPMPPAAPLVSESLQILLSPELRCWPPLDMVFLEIQPLHTPKTQTMLLGFKTSAVHLQTGAITRWDWWRVSPSPGSLPLRHWISATSARKWLNQNKSVLTQVLPFRDAHGLVKKTMHSKTAWFLPFSLFKWHFFWRASFLTNLYHIAALLSFYDGWQESPVFLAISLVFPDQSVFQTKINCVKNCWEIPNMLVCEWGSNCILWLMRISTTKLSSMGTE